MKRDISVLLLSPVASCRPQGNFGDSHLVTLGSYLRHRTGAQVEVVDLDYERYLPVPDPQRIFQQQFSVVGISCYSSYDYLSAFYLAKEIRRLNPDTVLVTGGYHPSARPEDFLHLPGSLLEEASPLDHVVVGEGELPLARIVEAAARGERLTDPVLGPETLDDLDDLPPLDWSLLDRYRHVARTIGGQVSLSFSRGCPYRCSFCMERSKGESCWRAWSPERAEQELVALDSWLDLRGWKVFIADAVFGLKRSWRREMLKRLVRRVVNVEKVWTLTRVDLLEQDDVDLFHAAGFGVGLGLESGDARMLELTGKTRDADGFLDRFRDFAPVAAAVGLPWGANVIVGHPGETADSLERSARFTERLFLDTKELSGFLSIDPFRHYPGALADEQRLAYAQRFGARVHRPRWWNYSEQAFNSEWIDPSAELDYRRREMLTARLFGPVVDGIARNFAYEGPAADYFRRSVVRAQQELQPPNRLRGMADYHLWRRLTGQSQARLIDDPEAQSHFQQARHMELVRVAGRFHREPPARILAALTDEPRERYVPAGAEIRSWRDTAVPLNDDETASLSALHSYVLNYWLLELREADRLVEVGAGTGYGAAVAARIVGSSGTVVTFEIDPKLAALAQRNLAGRENVTVVVGDGLQPSSLPEFNKALFSCALDEIPQCYLDALPEGGRLVAHLPEGDGEGEQVLAQYVRRNGRLAARRHGAVNYVRAIA